MPNTGAPSLASAKRLAEHVAGGQAGGWLVSASQREGAPAAAARACRVYAPGGSTHPLIPSGDLAQAKVKLIALRYSHCDGAINS